MEWLALVIRLSHVMYVAFVIAGPMFLLAGVLLKSRILCSPWLRGVHMLAVGYVVLQFVFGWACPLTQLEAFVVGHNARSFLPEQMTDMDAVVGRIGLLLAILYLVVSSGVYARAWFGNQLLMEER